jgi:hypothetical protein
MAEDQGFLERWSKRKRAARAAEVPAVAAAERAEEPPAEPLEAEAAAPEIDPADLPAIESIKTGADIQAFLQKGVPKALRQAALRRLWSADPTIREFREVADYDWDFNAPGYGALLPGDDPKAVAEKLFAAMRRARAVTEQPAAAAEPRATSAALEPAIAEPATPDEAPPTTAAEPEPSRPNEAPEAAAANPAAATSPRRRRRHGAATPS